MVELIRYWLLGNVGIRSIITVYRPLVKEFNDDTRHNHWMFCNIYFTIWWYNVWNCCAFETAPGSVLYGLDTTTPYWSFWFTYIIFLNRLFGVNKMVQQNDDKKVQFFVYENKKPLFKVMITYNIKSNVKIKRITITKTTTHKLEGQDIENGSARQQ